MKTETKTLPLKLDFTKLICLASPLLCMPLASGQTFKLSDNLAADGSGTVVGTVNTGSSPTEIEETGNYRQSDGQLANPSNYDAIMVGSNYGGSDIFRAVMTYDFSFLPAAPAGFLYNVTNVSLIMEVSGGSTNGQRPSTLVDFYEGSFPTGALPGTADASVTFNSPDSTFITTSLGLPAFDINTDSSASFTLDAPLAASNPGGNFYTFGSGQKVPNSAFTGTAAIQKSPELLLTYSLEAVPEPSSALLLISGIVGALGIRRRA